MSSINQKTCSHCGSIRNADESFCGNCGRPFASGTSYPTRHDEELQQGLRAQVPSDPEHPTYAPDSTQPVYPSSPFLPPQGNGLQGKTRVWQLASLISVPLVVILLLVIIFQAVRSTNSQNPNVSNIQSPAAGQPGAGNTSTPATQPTSTVTPPPTPTPTPTSLPTPGKVLCQPKAGDWPQTSDWQTVNAEYVNKDGNSTPIIAPCDIPVSDYYVEAKIRTSQSNFDALMGVLARVNPENGAGYKGGISYATFCGENCGQAALYDLLNSQQNTVQIGSLFANTVYTVKLKVKGTDVTLYVNKNLVLEQHYTSANDAGKVGVECDQTCEVLQFTVVAQ